MGVLNSLKSLTFYKIKRSRPFRASKISKRSKVLDDGPCCEYKISKALEYVKSFGRSKISKISKVLEYQTISLGLLKSQNVLKF